MQHRLFTDKDRQVYEGLCRQTESTALTAMARMLDQCYHHNIVQTKNYIIAYGDIPVALIAHADTVFPHPPQDFFYDTQANVFWSPDGMGADDRAGLFAIYKLVHDYKLRPHIIITTGEEMGCVGAIKLAAEGKFKGPLNFMIQLDRRGAEDSVYYDCENPDFENYINGFGFKTAIGTYTDISTLAPAYGVAAVNLSVGYQFEHTESEHLYVDVLYSTIDKTAAILKDVAKHPISTIYKYIEKKYTMYANGKMTTTNNIQSQTKDPFVMCEFCGTVQHETMMVPVKFRGQSKQEDIFHLCGSCFADYLHEINMCSQCGDAWYLNEKVPNQSWVCPNCKQKEKDIK